MSQKKNTYNFYEENIILWMTPSTLNKTKLKISKALFNPLKTGFHLHYTLNFSCYCTENTLCDHHKDQPSDVQGSITIKCEKYMKRVKCYVDKRRISLCYNPLYNHKWTLLKLHIIQSVYNLKYFTVLFKLFQKWASGKSVIFCPKVYHIILIYIYIYIYI